MLTDDRRDEAAIALLLLDAPSFGPTRVLKLLTDHGTARAAFEQLLHSTTTPDALRSFLEATPLAGYEACLAETIALGGNVKLWSDDDYPANLRRWSGRPPVLFFKGDLAKLGDRSLALVGRVDPTEAGIAAATRFARRCVDNDITVVSGLAKGIDGASHRGSLLTPPGDTFAVLGHGLDFAYPHENDDLYKAIPSNGALISQFRTGVGPQRWTFPARNEVMCTLALGTVIVEGKQGCGSLIQADFSFKHDRPVFLLAKNLEGADADWADDLVGKGAHIIERFDQVLEILEGAVGTSGAPAPAAMPVALSLFDEPVASAMNRTRPPSAALFDLDGVVVDTRAANAAALAVIATRHTGRDIGAADVVVTGKPHDALARLGVRNAYQVYKAEYDEIFARERGEIGVFDEVIDGLRSLANSGVHLAAVTAQPKRRADAMLPDYVRRLFEIVLCYNDTKGRKDVGISTALRRFGVDPSRAVYVGDQPTDLQAAATAGVRGVGVLWGFSAEAELRRAPHDFIFRTPSELGTSLVGILLG